MLGFLNQKSLSVLFLHQESPTDLHQDIIYGCLHLQDEAVAGIILVQCELVIHTEGRYWGNCSAGLRGLLVFFPFMKYFYLQLLQFIPKKAKPLIMSLENATIEPPWKLISLN